MRVIKKPYIFRQMLRDNPDKIFLFGDNMVKTGFGGQAKEMRGEPNAVGVPTKELPSRYRSSYFTDADYDRITALYDYIFDNLPRDTVIVVPKEGLGTGLAQLDTRAPRIFAYLQKKLKKLENGE